MTETNETIDATPVPAPDSAPAGHDRLVGAVAIVGRPNSGKSTFINALIEEKVSIVSQKPQTTQRTVRGIYTTPEMQVVFFDTAGIHLGNDRWNEAVNRHALRSLNNANVILHFVDSSRPTGVEETNVRAILNKAKAPVVRVLTRVDLPRKIEPDYARGAIEISSVDRTGFEALLDAIRPHLEKAPLLYDEDYYTDQDMYTRISEIVREKLFQNLDEEIPYSIYVETAEVDEREDGLLRALAYIYVERDSQKAIIIGKNARFLTEIGTAARLELEEIFGRKVFLQLRVKHMPKWKRNDRIVEGLLE